MSGYLVEREERFYLVDYIWMGFWKVSRKFLGIRGIRLFYMRRINL